MDDKFFAKRVNVKEISEAKIILSESTGSLKHLPSKILIAQDEAENSPLKFISVRFLYPEHCDYVTRILEDSEYVILGLENPKVGSRAIYVGRVHLDWETFFNAGNQIKSAIGIRFLEDPILIETPKPNDRELRRKDIEIKTTDL